MDYALNFSNSWIQDYFYHSTSSEIKQKKEKETSVIEKAQEFFSQLLKWYNKIILWLEEMILMNMVSKPISSITMLELQWFGVNFPSKFPWPQPLLILLNILFWKICWFDLQETYLFRVLHFLLIFWIDVRDCLYDLWVCSCMSVSAPSMPSNLEALRPSYWTTEGR